MPKSVVSKEPRVLILYGMPKVGKTELVSTLPNALIIDCDDGASFQSGYFQSCKSVREFKEICRALRAEQHKFKFVVVDTVSELEAFCLPEAKIAYKSSVIGKNFNGDSVLDLPEGAGYHWLRKTFLSCWDALMLTHLRIILIAHVKDKFISDKQTNNPIIQSQEIDLTGKLKTIAAARADAIGYVYRDKNTLGITFASNNAITCGCRCPHLVGQKLLGPTYWPIIYPDTLAQQLG